MDGANADVVDAKGVEEHLELPLVERPIVEDENFALFLDDYAVGQQHQSLESGAKGRKPKGHADSLAGDGTSGIGPGLKVVEGSAEVAIGKIHLQAGDIGVGTSVQAIGAVVARREAEATVARHIAQRLSLFV